MMPGGPGHLTAAVVSLAAEAERSREPHLAQVARRCSRRLSSPLRIAVVGRSKTGKSTLLNALLETAMAPTDAGECTKVVYEFRHDQLTTASLVTQHGRRPVRLTNSRLPTQLPLPASEVRYVEVTMPAPLLRRTTLIDTPGLASTNENISDVTQRMMDDTSDSAARADALLYCVKDALQNDEAEAVRSFRRGSGARRLSAITAIGILTRADEFGGDRRTAWQQACEMARTMTQRHAHLFAAVVPVVGLLAETAGTGALQERHARALADLAASWTPQAQGYALASPEVFAIEPGAVGGEMRAELLALLGFFGMNEALNRQRAGVRAGATELNALAAAASGIGEVHRQLETSLYGHADLLKAAGVLDALRQAAMAAGDDKINDHAQRMLDEPAMFPLRVVEMAQILAAGEVLLPRLLQEQVRRAVQTGLPPVTSAEADRQAGQWRAWERLADADGRRIARVMVRAWQLTADKESR
jgi:Dynamin family